MKLKFKEHKEPKLLKLDLGTGKGRTKPDGFVGVDIIKFKGVDKVVDLTKPWPWKSASVDEAQAVYVLNYLTQKELVHFVNELHRVLKKGAKALIVVPHWCASKAYADVRIKSVLAEAWFPQLNKGQRDAQNSVDTSGLKCDFDFTLGYGLHPLIIPRAEEYKHNALMWWKEAAQDTCITLTKR